MSADLRIKQLSYSSNMTLHSCPRKFQLYKLKAVRDEAEEDPNSISGITFAYGHAVGTGIQMILEGRTQEEILWHTFLNWKPDLFAKNEKDNKGIFSALLAIEKFIGARKGGFLAGYKLAYHNDLPATELGFIIQLPDGFVFRGFVDAVLVHEVTGEILVLECKTTKSKVVNPAQYKNSAQAIGYSIVLDAIFPDTSSYEVLYQVYKSTASEWESFRFKKSYMQRALWIQELLLDVETIKAYDAVGVYPMRGESCFSYYRECEYFNSCTLSTKYLTQEITDADKAAIEKENSKYAIKVTIADLINAQLAKE